MKNKDIYMILLIIFIVYITNNYINAKQKTSANTPVIIKEHAFLHKVKDPYLYEIDSIYGVAKPNKKPQPYPYLYSDGPDEPFNSPEWIL